MVIDVDNDPHRIPVHIRLRALKEALIAFDRVLVAEGIEGLDYFGRFEAIELALQDAQAIFDAQLPPVLEN